MTNLELFTNIGVYYAGVRTFVGNTTLSIVVGNITVKYSLTDIARWTEQECRDKALALVKQYRLVRKANKAGAVAQVRVESYVHPTQVVIASVTIGSVWANMPTPVIPTVKSSTRKPRVPKAPKAVDAVMPEIGAH